MKPQEVKYYMQAMDRLKARERLVLMDAFQYVNLEPKDKKKKHREVYRKAYPENFDMKKIVKTTELELF